MLSAAGDDYLRPVIIEAAVGLQARSGGTAQLRYACGGGVFGLALAYRVHADVLDVHGRLKIRLARAETDDVQPIRAHLLCHGVYGQGGRGVHVLSKS